MINSEDWGERRVLFIIVIIVTYQQYHQQTLHPNKRKSNFYSSVLYRITV
jgi:hypothetical protein